MTISLLTDKGNVITQPITGFRIEPVAGMAILLVLEYVDTPAELETGARHQLQGILYSPQAREIAASLTRVADHIDEPPASTTGPIH